jgi:ABC-type sugar transport system permease subunit
MAKKLGKTKADNTQYCLTWLYNLTFQSSMIYGSAILVSVINLLATNIIEYTAFLIGGHTVADEVLEKHDNI